MPKEIPLTKGFMALVDDEDYERLSQWTWHAHIGGSGIIYARRNTSARFGKSITIVMHREILDPNRTSSMIIDHIDRDGRNNQRSNLRFVTPSENQRNRKCNRNNSCGIKGVKFSPREGWIARITINGERKRLGAFASPQEAQMAYALASREYHGEFGTIA